jgi:hypothetical protein
MSDPLLDKITAVAETVQGLVKGTVDVAQVAT